MARPRQTLSMEEKIAKAEAAVEKTKEKYDAALRKLKSLQDKKSAMEKVDLNQGMENDDESDDEDLDFLLIEDVVSAMDLKEAFHVLNEMMNTFEDWFPLDESDTEEDLESYKNRFAGTKLCLELGEYSGDDYDYLHYIQGVVAGNPRFYQAIRTFISALSREYRW